MEKFRRNSFVKELNFDGSFNYLYPVGDREELDAIESSKQAIYYGDIKSFTFEYDELCSDSRFINHHIHLYTEYSDNPICTVSHSFR